MSGSDVVFWFLLAWLFFAVVWYGMLIALMVSKFRVTRPAPLPKARVVQLPRVPCTCDWQRVRSVPSSCTCPAWPRSVRS